MSKLKQHNLAICVIIRLIFDDFNTFAASCEFFTCIYDHVQLCDLEIVNSHMQRNTELMYQHHLLCAEREHTAEAQSVLNALV